MIAAIGACDECSLRDLAPFTHLGKLHAEVSIEPRRVMRIDSRSGRATDVNRSAPCAAVVELQEQLGAPLLLGPPPLRLALPRGRKLFLGLAHAHIPGALVAPLPARSFHVFYVFSPRPPFEIVGLGRPFTLPSELRLTQTVSGMLLRDDGRLLLSFSEHDCEARLASMPLDDALADIRW